MVLSIDCPVIDTPTGWAAPVFVPGAMTKMSQAIAIKNPAEAERAPLGLTNATIGVFELRILSMISLIEVSSPPGVFRAMMSNRAFSFSALSIAFRMYSEVIG